MMIASPRPGQEIPVGLGDWFEPTCQIGDPDCVPHWYCYVPGMATSDCLASLGVGVQTIAGGAGQVAGGVVNSAVTGTVQGITGAGSATSSITGNVLTPLLLVAGVGIGAYFLFKR